MASSFASAPPGRPSRHAVTDVGRAVRAEDLLFALADRPFPAMAGYMGTTLVAADPVEVVIGPSVWDVLHFPVSARTVSPAGGWLGYLGYTLGLRDRHAARPAADREAPDAVLCRYATLAQIGPDGRCRVLGRGPQARRLARLAAALGPGSPPQSGRRAGVRSSLDAGAYADRVREISRRIREGDCSQVNLVQRLTATWPDAAAGFAARLWAAAGPAAHRAYFGTPQGTLVSASPECLLRVRDGVAVSAPIKGTAPPGGAVPLAHSAKDRAEHIMIVDLVRNDLGRVARLGGVSVPRLMAPLATGYVEHLVSEVRAELAPGTRASDVLAAVFPAGSITGCPKLAAMRIIDELEPVARGPAFGSMLAVGPDGGVEASVLIRTAWLTGDQARYWSGGAVVWDSDPVGEHAEAMAKARPFLEALGCA